MSTRLFNGGTQPLVVQWGHGVVMPGEFIVVDNPETYGPPWTEDPEADEAVRKAQEELQKAERDLEAADAADGLSEPQNGPDGPSLHTLPNGDVVNEAGEIVGHIDQPSA